MCLNAKSILNFFYKDKSIKKMIQKGVAQRNKELTPSPKTYQNLYFQMPLKLIPIPRWNQKINKGVGHPQNIPWSLTIRNIQNKPSFQWNSIDLMM